MNGIISGERIERSVLISSHECCIAHDVRQHDGGMSAIFWHGEKLTVAISFLPFLSRSLIKGKEKNKKIFYAFLNWICIHGKGAGKSTRKMNNRHLLRISYRDQNQYT